MRKRITSLFLVLAICLTLLPTTALAEEAGAAQETQDSTEVGDGYTIEEDTAVQGKGENDKAVQTVQALIDALPAAEDISDANADEVSGQLDAIDEAKQALTEEQAAQLDFAKYDAAAAAVLALAGEPDANEPVLLAAIAGTKPGGSGTAVDPYQITSAAELIWLRDAVNAGEANTCAELQQDVTYVDEVWTSIGTSEHPYTGTFNGNGHTIRVWLHGRGQALFGYVGADAKLTDLAVTKRQSENYSISASAPLARINNGTITHCWYSGDITAKSTLGGLVYTNNGTIEACYVYAGKLGGSRIEMYYGGRAGGIAYENTGTIVNSYFYGDIVQAQSNGTVRDIIGSGAIAYEKSGGKIINCYYGADSDDGYGGKTEDQFRGGEVTYLLNGGTARDDWRQNRYAGDDTPVLDRSHAQVRKSGDYYVSLYPHVHCICGGGTMSGGHPQHNDVTYTAWTDDEAASQYGASSYTAANSLPKKTGNYYLTSDVTLRDTGTWRPADGTVLCLNGQTVREFAFDTPAYDAITVGSGVTFSLTECASIQGYIYCASSRRAVHTVNNSGTFNLYNGRLRGTTSTADGAAVYNNGTFNMYGGTINDNNTTALGGGVYNAGACNLYGGTITNNGTGGGVYNNGTLTVGGTATVTGNSPNVYLASGKVITLNGDLDESARIGITAEKQSGLTDAANIIVVNGGAAQLNRFFPDDDGTCDLSDDGGSNIILHLIRDHTHCACGHKTKYAGDIGSHAEHKDLQFVAWTDKLLKEQYGSETKWKVTDTLPKQAGYYYLTDDVNLGSWPWGPKAGTILCLNGHKITSSSTSTTVRIDSDAHIVLTDCRASGAIINTSGTNGAEALSSSGNSTSRNGIADVFKISLSGTSVGVENYTSNTVNLYNSTISGTRGAIYNTGTVNIAGTVKATSNTANSGDYCVKNLGMLNVDGTLTADGGDIGVVNHSENSRSGTMKVDGIVTSTGSSNGLSNRGAMTVTGTLTAIGKTYYGLYNDKNGTLTVNGTLTAAGNASGDKSCGLYNAGGTATVIGTLAASGGQYGVYNYGPLNLAGTVNVTNHVYLGKGQTITVVGELDDATSITVQTLAMPASGSPVTIATTENAGWIKAGSFVSWTPSKYAVSRTDEGKTVVLKEHEHEWGYTLSSDGTTITAACVNTDGLCGNTNGGSVTIAAPSGNLTYDGSGKAAMLDNKLTTGVTELNITYQKKNGENFEAFNGTPTDAGTYTASITVGEGNKAATASVTYTIGKATPKAEGFTFSAPTSLTYDGNVKSATVSPAKAGTGDVIVKYYDKDGKEATPKNAGEYTVKIDVAESTNYAAANGLTADGWKFSITKAAPTLPTGLTGVTGKKLSTVGLPAGWSWTNGDTMLDAAGNYTFEASYTGDGNHNGTTTNLTVTVSNKSVDKNTLSLTQPSMTYGQGELPAYELTHKPATVSENRVHYTGTLRDNSSYDSDAKPTQAGSYTVTVMCETADTIYTASANFTIYPIDLGDGSHGVGFSSPEITYTGNAETASVHPLGPNGSPQMKLNTDYEISGTISATNVGKYTATIQGIGNNYTGEVSGTWQITPAPLTITGATVTAKTYDGSTSAQVTGVTFTGLKNNEQLELGTDYAVTAAAFNNANVNAANKVTGTVALKNTENAKNYTLSSATFEQEATIGKADFTGTISKTIPIVKNRTAPQTGSLTAADFFPANQVPDGAAITYVTPGSGTLMITVALNGGQFSYDSKCNLSDAADETYTVTIATTNYTDIKATLTFHLTDKETVTISGLTYTDKTYDGQPIAPTGALVVSGDKVPVGELEVLYTGTGSTVYQSADAPKNAGTYQVTYKVAESNESCIGSVAYSFTIAPKQVTVAPKSISMTKGDALPAFELAYDGLVQGESLTPSAQPIFTCFESDGTTAVTANTAAGTYAITWTNADGTTFSDANYIVTKEAAGTLTITARPSSGGGGSSSPNYPVTTPGKTENGTVTVSPRSAEKGDTVTITAKPDSGYQLDDLTVTDKNGKELKLTDKGNGKYTFTMPASKVEVNATFVKEVETSPFSDVSTSAYYYEAVKWAQEKGITGGIGNGLFGPNQPCTRAQIVTFLWRAAGSPVVNYAMNMTDVAEDAYYGEAVRWALSEGITTGTGDGKFSPDATCNRAQSVTFLFRAIGKIVDSKAEFGDVLTDSYYANAVAWAVENGITNGIGDGLFGPDNSCTRAQIVTFLFRAYQGK